MLLSRNPEVFIANSKLWIELLNPRLHLAKQHSNECLYLKVSVCLSAAVPNPQSLKYTNFILPQEPITELVTTCHVTSLEWTFAVTKLEDIQIRPDAVQCPKKGNQNIKT